MISTVVPTASAPSAASNAARTAGHARAVSVPRSRQMSRPGGLPTGLRKVRDPRSGQVIEAPIASCVEIGFAPTLASTWRIAEAPGHLVPLSQGDHTFVFMVFSPRSEPTPLRLVRSRHDDGDLEERVVHVVPRQLAAVG